MSRSVAFLFLFTLTFTACSSQTEASSSPYLLILGTAQDAGYPQAGCYKPHCMRAWNAPELKRFATSFALVDPVSKKKWLFEATPDIKEQLYLLEQHAPDSIYKMAGVFLTHGHMGHYTGLMHFGREVMGAKNIPVYAMPRMKEYLTNNGPWSQLVTLGNIDLVAMSDSTSVKLSEEISVTPFLVPHRDEFTETVGYRIVVESTTVVFIPDIDKWSKWDVDIKEVVRESNISLLDATFFDGDELPGRNMNDIPHPFVQESLALFSDFNADEKNKIHFIHLNHSNPLHIEGSSPSVELTRQGYHIAEQGKILLLD